MNSIADRLGQPARELLAAWTSLPRQGGVPRRADFDPMSVARILPVVSLVERVEGGWRLRLVGTEIERRWGRALTGIDYRELLSPAAAEVTFCEFGAICGQPCGSWSLRRLELASGRRLTAETLRLPLRGGDGSVSLILSCSGELSGRVLPEPDRPREIVTVVEQRFVDIGAGLPGIVCLRAAAAA